MSGEYVQGNVRMADRKPASVDVDDLRVAKLFVESNAHITAASYADADR